MIEHVVTFAGGYKWKQTGTCLKRIKCQKSERKRHVYRKMILWYSMVPLHASRYVPNRMLDTVSTKNHIFPECVARVPVSLWGSGG